jgi:hypothetical protein
LIRTAIETNGVVPHTVHADRGTSMTSKPVAQLLTDLDVVQGTGEGKGVPYGRAVRPGRSAGADHGCRAGKVMARPV